MNQINMAEAEDTRNAGGDHTEGPPGGAGGAAGAGGGGAAAAAPTVAQFLLANKVESAMWVSRLSTVVSSILFFIPLLGTGQASAWFQRALLFSALTSALRLHQRLPHPSLSRVFLSQALLEDSCHYLLYSLIFVNAQPITMSLLPVFLFSLLHATAHSFKVLNILGPGSMPLVRSFLTRVSAQQQNILKLVACNEIFLMPATLLMLFSGHCSLFLPFFYYRFLTLRYASRRNPYCRVLFSELRMAVESATANPSCPAVLRSASQRIIGFVSRLAPPVQP